MNQDADQLREAFVAHEYLAPDAADVIAVVHERARRYRRRRRAAQSAGGAVLGAGLVAGTVAAPGWLQRNKRSPRRVEPLVGCPLAAANPDGEQPRRAPSAVAAHRRAARSGVERLLRRRLRLRQRARTRAAVAHVRRPDDDQGRGRSPTACWSEAADHPKPDSSRQCRRRGRPQRLLRGGLHLRGRRRAGPALEDL